MAEIIETKCTECEFVDQLFNKFCSKYDIVIAADVKPLTFEDKKRIIELICMTEKNRIRLDDDYKHKLYRLKQIKIRYELICEFLNDRIDMLFNECDNRIYRRIGANHKKYYAEKDLEKDLGKDYYEQRSLKIDPIYEEDKNYSIKYEEYEECKHCGSFVTKFLCCAGIGAIILTIIKIIAALV